MGWQKERGAKMQGSGQEGRNRVDFDLTIFLFYFVLFICFSFLFIS